MRRLGTKDNEGRYFDFSEGVVGGISDYGLRSRHLRQSDNLLGRPKRALGTVRNGYQEAQNSQLPGEPTSMNKFIPRVGGTSRVLVHCKTGIGTGEIVSIQPGTAGYTVETPPPGFNVSDQDWDFAQLNYTMYGVQTADTQLPTMYSNYGGGNHLDSMKLMKPTMLPPVGTASSASGIGVDVGYHWYRLRYVYTNGASVAGPAFPVGGINVPDVTHMTVQIGDNVTVAPTNQPASLVPPAATTIATTGTTTNSNTFTVASTGAIKVGWAIQAAGGTIPAGAFVQSITNGTTFVISINNVGTSSPGDTLTFNAGSPGTFQGYLGWYLERTKIATVNAGLYSGTLGSNALPTAQATWWVVNQLGTTSNYTDVFPDAALTNQADDTIYGDPPHMEGIIAFKDRLVGWNHSTLYVSQSLNDANASGPCNWNAQYQYFIGEDDGDIITSARVQYDRLILMKTRSIVAIEGSTPGLDLRPINLAKGPGCVGRRCSAVVGHFVYMLGESGFHTVMGNYVDYGGRNRTALQWGKLEVDHYLADMNPALRSKVVMTNVAGEFLSIAYASSLATSNDQEIVYDFQMREFRHYTGRRIRDSYVQFDNDTDFGGATMLWIDPTQVGSAATGYDQNPAIIAWADNRVNSNVYRTFAQPVLGASGASQWVANGVTSLVAGGPSSMPGVASDFAGGWYVLGSDQPSTNRVAVLQHYNADSTVYAGWPVGGLILGGNGSSSFVLNFRLTPDGVGGVIACWYDQNATAGLYVQRVSKTGTKLWNSGNALLLTNSVGGATELVSDGLSGAFIVTGNRVYHLDLNGSHLWPSGGTSLGNVNYPMTFCTDTLGGCYVVGVNASTQLTVWRFNSTGSSLGTWGTLAAPTPLVLTTTNRVDPNGMDWDIVPDGVGGVIACWYDTRSSLLGVYAQRVNSSKAAQWTANGVAVSATVPSTYGVPLGTGSAFNHSIVAVQDGNGGAMIAFAWFATSTSPMTIYVQGVNSAGAAEFSGGDVLLATVPQPSSGAGFGNACTDGAGGIIVVWNTTFTVSGADVYAQRVTSLGNPLWGTGGVAVTNLSTSSQVYPAIAFTGSPAGQFPPSLSPAYRMWRTTSQYLDAVLADGTGGKAIAVRGQTPFLDDGLPDYVKDLQRINVMMDGGLSNLTANVTVDLGDGSGLRTASVGFSNLPSGTVLGDESATVLANDLHMANEDGSAVVIGGITVADVMASDLSDAPFSGLPAGTKGKRYQWEFTANATDVGTIYGFVCDGIIDPERSFS